ncbi:MAG TPA: S8 family serine peptidase [bacterium]|nr:S8 family serine peptidase [bacterium]
MLQTPYRRRGSCRVSNPPDPPQCGTGTYTDIADGITYAADHGAKVINLSLGGSAASTTLENAVNYAYNRGVTLVAAAGNENGPVLYPAVYSNVIAVAATACNNAKASYSNSGPQIDVAAPGGDGTVTCGGGNPNTTWVWSPSWSPTSGNQYFGMRGTSMATPHVAGVAALLISRGITTPAGIQATLQDTATDLGAFGRDDIFGYGLINAASAVGGGTAASRLRAFSGNLSGSTLTIRSDIVQVASSGSFQITNAHAGIRSVFAWQDFNEDGILDAGDYFGQTNGVVITDGATTSGVAVTVSFYSGAAITPQNVLTIGRSR